MIRFFVFFFTKFNFKYLLKNVLETHEETCITFLSGNPYQHYLKRPKIF